MSNPFDNAEGTFLVLANDENQHSLWPEFVEIPAGWTVVHPADSKQSCLDYIEANWIDMRPKSLIESMG
ncbi:protein mbtH [Streptomyces sp. AS58]|uniref:MbtH family protein n=1 Tax=Streptomyces sp. AS58 TaxID=1519489 RepID=UPI0006AFA6FC|nr:MbtH family protein [Streptomyces sp. AS58]KOV57632.1 protein mbtH [Streptomyces sp. AS58]